MDRHKVNKIIDDIKEQCINDKIFVPEAVYLLLEDMLLNFKE